MLLQMVLSVVVSQVRDPAAQFACAWEGQAPPSIRPRVDNLFKRLSSARKSEPRTRAAQASPQRRRLAASRLGQCGLTPRSATLSLDAQRFHFLVEVDRKNKPRIR